jgi:16S rRNA (guanine527-N7)-methyltransferase
VSARLGALAQRWELGADAVAALERYLALLAADDTAPTTVRAPAAALDRHVADTLVALDLPAVRGARAIADLGSGAGVPGLVLAAALPDARVALVESVGRKAAFLGRAADVMGLSNAEVVGRRAEDWPEGLGCHDLVTARAVAPLAVLAEYAAPLLASGGALVAWKGRVDDAERAAGAAAAEILGLEASDPLPVAPYAAAEHRSLHLYLKVRSTPNRYPRRPGMARKRPLGGSTSG